MGTRSLEPESPKRFHILAALVSSSGFWNTIIKTSRENVGEYHIDAGLSEILDKYVHCAVLGDITPCSQ